MIGLARGVTFVLFGVLIAETFNIENIDQSPLYLNFVHVLLAIGLYASTYSIDLTTAKSNARLIITAVTVGVLIKALLIGAVLSIVLGNPIYLVLGVVVAQIDPLSVASIMHNTRMSPRAKTILASWSSFDDPITAIIAIYASTLVTNVFQLGNSSSSANADSDLVHYFLGLSWNVTLVIVAFGIWCLIREKKILLLLWLGAVLAIAVRFFLMLGVAIAGLFLRPPIERLIPHITKVAMALSELTLGILLIDHIDIFAGLCLGVMAFIAQIVVGLLLTRSLPKIDRFHLAFAQQNGITAIILALLLEQQFTGTVGIVAPAIFFINLIYVLTNKLLDLYTVSWRDPQSRQSEA